MTQICPFTLYGIVVVSGFVVYVIAIVAVYRRMRNASKPSVVVETKKKTRSPQPSSVAEKSILPSEDSNPAILREINEKLSNIDAIAKFTKTRSIADKLAEAQEKAGKTDPIKAKIAQTVKAPKTSESPQSEDPKPETISEGTEELA